MSERIAVLGGGAIGMLLVARLALSGQDVRLWTRTAEQAQIVREQGLEWQALPPGEPKQVRLPAEAFDQVTVSDADAVIVALKQTALTEGMLRRISQAVANDAALLLLQNGVGHMERLSSALPGRPLLAAVTTEGAFRAGIASVRHTGEGDTWIGSWPSPSLLEPILADRSHLAALKLKQMMKKAGFSAFLSNDIRKRILRKLLINAVINPLTALWRIRNGELTASPDRLAAMQALFRETVHILRLHGGLRETSDSQLWKSVLGVCAATAANRSSMLQDVLAGRETEIEAMNGAICRIAADAGVPAPWNEAVTTLVKAIL